MLSSLFNFLLLILSRTTNFWADAGWQREKTYDSSLPKGSGKNLIIGQWLGLNIHIPKISKSVSVTEVINPVSLFSQTTPPLLLLIQIFQNFSFPRSKLYPFKQLPQYQLKETCKLLIFSLAEVVTKIVTFFIDFFVKWLLPIMAYLNKILQVLETCNKGNIILY